MTQNSGHVACIVDRFRASPLRSASPRQPRHQRPAMRNRRQSYVCPAITWETGRRRRPGWRATFSGPRRERLRPAGSERVRRPSIACLRFSQKRSAKSRKSGPDTFAASAQRFTRKALTASGHCRTSNQRGRTSRSLELSDSGRVPGKGLPDFGSPTRGLMTPATDTADTTGKVSPVPDSRPGPAGD